MARTINRLTTKKIQNTKKPGYYGDGGGLYLQVSATGSKSWIYRYMLNRRAREMGLGSINALTLAEAREQARENRKLLLEKIDPIEARNAAQAEIMGSLTFNECATKYIEAHRAGWKNEKHAQQWENTLNTYASPVFGKLPVQRVDTALVMKALEPIWTEKPETANRVRGRVELVLDWATVRKYRAGENPARWRGHLDKLLPKRSKVAAVKHHPALPYDEMSDFMKALRKRDGVAPKALEYVILTVCRVSEAVMMQWLEIDFKARTWTIPGERTKSKRPHRVPLTDDALAILETMKAQKQNDYVFPGWKIGKPLTGAACLKLLQQDMSYPDLTVHGFRSTFRDWAAECTNYPRELAEAALAHVLSDKTEAAYQRGDLLQRRAHMMDAWAKYCRSQKTTAKVTPIRKRKTG